MIVRTGLTGLYRAHRPSPEKGVTHHAVIDYDNVLDLRVPGRPVVFEIVEREHLRVRLLEPHEVWTQRRIADQAGARERVELLWNSREQHQYDVLFKNCEHVATYIETGKPRSEQVRGALVVATAVGLLALAAKGKK